MSVHGAYNFAGAERKHGASSFADAERDRSISAGVTIHGATNFAELFASAPSAAGPRLGREHSSGDGVVRTLYFIRHCEGEHNACRDSGGSSSYLIADAMLSPKGEEQAATLASDSAFHDAETGKTTLPELVVASPLRRTMQTALLGFGSADVAWALRPELQETSMMPCDCAQPELGAELLASMAGGAALAGEYAGLRQDFHVKGSGWRSTVLDRFKAVLLWLSTRPELTVAIVTHHDFLKSNLARSFAPGEVSAYRLEGTRLTALDSLGGEASPNSNFKLRTGLKLSGFYRSPRNSKNASQNDLARLDRTSSTADSESERSESRKLSVSRESSASRESSSNNLVEAFKNAVSMPRKTSMKVKLGSVPSQLDALG